MDEKLENRVSNDIDQLTLQAISSSEQHKARFLKHSPFITLMIMSFGPLVTTLTTTLMDFLELYFLTQRFSQQDSIKPVQLQGFAGFCVTLVILITTYFATAVSTRLSRIIGENREKDAIQFFTDITKVGFIFILFIMPLIQFLVHPLLSFMNCPEFMENYCYLFSINAISAAPFLFLFNIACSFLQAIGRSFLNGILHIGQSVLQVLILCPLFLFVFKIDITLISLQSAVSQSIIGLVLFVMIYTNKFGYDVNFSSYKLPILKDTVKALINALPSVVSFICNVGPPIFLMKFLLSTATSEEMAESLAGVTSILGKVTLLSGSVAMAVSNGFLTVSTFAYGSHDIDRLLKYFIYSILVTVGFGIVFSLFMIIKPDFIASIYLDSATDLSFSNKILKIPFYTNWFSPLNMMCQILLICTGKPLHSSIPSFVQTFVIIFLAFVFSKMYRDSPERIFHAYNINDILILILSLSLTIPVIVKLRKDKRQTEDTVTLIGANVDF